MTLTRRQFVAGSLASGIAPMRAPAADVGTVSPEMFGAKGDGQTNDSNAFTAMSRHLNARGGGTIVLRPVTYLVGAQHPSSGGTKPSFGPAGIIGLFGCTRAITIHGGGATLRCAPGLRYGRFDPLSGEPLPNPPEGKSDSRNEAIPYQAMIWIHHCSGKVEVSDIELDGNLGSLRIGGSNGRGGWQAGASGIRLEANTGPELLSRIHTHHHAQDGLMVNPTIDRKGATVVKDVVCEYNGRQGCSVTGGRNLFFERCKFRQTGRQVFHSAPAAGVDVEAEAWPIRNVVFDDCEFSDNTGFGFVAGAQTNSADISFKACKFIGATNWAVWLGAPSTTFADCQFAGAIMQVHGVSDPQQATRFERCTFTDDRRLSPTGKIFLGRGGQRSIAVVQKSPNVLFANCRFQLTGEGLLPSTQRDTIFADCNMAQRSPAQSTLHGIFTGTTQISGNANLDGSIIRGRVILNGRVLHGTA